MHAPSVISLLVSGLAASTVAGWALDAPGTGLARCSVALLAVAVGPALAFPVDVAIEPRHHQGKGGKKKNNNNKRQEEEEEEDEDGEEDEEEHDLEARQPHHQGKGGKKKNN